MIIESTGRHVSIRRPGIFLCLDAAASRSPAFRHVADYLRRSAEDLRFDLRTVLLGWTEVLDGLPEAGTLNDYVRENRIDLRGAFITPLVEGPFRELTSGSQDLVLFFERRPHDYADWQEDLRGRFRNIHEYRTDEFNGQPPNTIEERLREDLLEPDNVTCVLRCINGVIWGKPDGFRFDLCEDGVRLVSEGPLICADVELKAQSLSEKVEILVGSQRASISGEAAPLIKWVKLKEGSDHFKDSIRAIFKKHERPRCYHCKNVHNDQRLFHCGAISDQGAVFAAGGIVFNEIRNDCQGAKAVIFKIEREAVLWSVCADPVVRVGDEDFAAFGEGVSVGLLRLLKDRVEVRLCEECFPGGGLFCLDERVYALLLRRGG